MDPSRDSSRPVLDVQGLAYSYRNAGTPVPVVKGISFQVRRQDFVTIQGPSGSGKSTLFYLIAGLLRPTEGKILLESQDLVALQRDELAEVRNNKIGFIFQQFHLLPGLSVFENILLPCRYPIESSVLSSHDREKAAHLAERLGIANELDRLPNQLSGGQQQRVAIARALMRDPVLLLADEPTGSLDSRSAEKTLDLLHELNEAGSTILLITHDLEVARRSPLLLPMRDGLLGSLVVQNQPPRESATPQQTSQAPESPPSKRENILPTRRRYLTALLGAAMENIARSKIKSALTMLGVVIGIAAVLAMLTLGQFTKDQILSGYEELGVNRIGVGGSYNWERSASEPSAVSFRYFEYERDMKPLPEIFPEIRLMSPMMMGYQTAVTYGGLTVKEDVRVMGVSNEMFAIANMKVQEGAPLTRFHIDDRSQVCVIGPEIQRQLFREQSPINAIVKVTLDEQLSFPCRVIGVNEKKKSPNEWMKPDSLIVVPYTYYLTVKPGGFYRIVIQARPGTDIEKSSERIKTYFEQKYGKSGRFWIDSDAALVDQMRRFLNIFTLLLASIALLSLVVGGIGINNMMLVSIAERLREIGLRKALGATDRSLRYQILCESLLLSLFAGVVGLLTGFLAYEGLIFGVSKFVDKVKFAWIFEPTAFVISFVSMVGVGILSGIVPAFRAQRLEVIEALRSE